MLLYNYKKNYIFYPFNILNGDTKINDCGEDIIVCVLHSWSLMTFNNDNGYYEPDGDKRYNNFEKFLIVYNNN